MPSRCYISIRVRGQNFERRNFKIASIKIIKDELCDSFIIEFIISFFKNCLNTQNIK